MPAGPSTGKTNQILTFSTSADTNVAGNLEYRFDWGNRNYSSWSSSPSVSHSWSSPGTYTIRAQARLVTGALTSEWSPSKTVNIAAETFRLSISVSPSGSGSVNPGSGNYDSETRVTLTATSVSAYVFDHWAGDASGTSPTITINMDSDKSIVANFTKLYQRIEDTMPPGSIGGSEVLYSKALKAGDKVDGFVQLAGQYYGIDWSYEWTFQIIGPGGEPIKPSWKGHWVNNNYHEFSFTASYAGTYKIRVYHASSYSKNLTIEIWPPGWGYSGS